MKGWKLLRVFVGVEGCSEVVRIKRMTCEGAADLNTTIVPSLCRVVFTGLVGHYE